MIADLPALHRILPPEISVRQLDGGDLEFKLIDTEAPLGSRIRTARLTPAADETPEQICLRAGAMLAP